MYDKMWLIQYMCSAISTILLIAAFYNNSHSNTDKVQVLPDLALAYVHKPGELASDLETAIYLAGEADSIKLGSLYINSMRQAK